MRADDGCLPPANRVCGSTVLTLDENRFEDQHENQHLQLSLEGACSDSVVDLGHHLCLHHCRFGVNTMKHRHEPMNPRDSISCLTFAALYTSLYTISDFDRT